MNIIIPEDVWRIIFSILLSDNHLFVFKFTREIILLANYTKSETEEMIKNAIILNFEITKVPFFDYCMENNQNILINKTFLNHLNALNSINDKYLCKLDYSYRSEKDIEYRNLEYKIKHLYGIKEEMRYSILEYSIKNNNFKLIEWISSKTKENKENKEKNFCFFAVKYNNLKMLEYFRKNNFPFDEFCCSRAVLNNNLEILRFLRENENMPCPWDKGCCYLAVRNRNFEMLKYLRSQNPPCEWEKESHLKSLDVMIMFINNSIKHPEICETLKNMREWILSQPS
jgi:hypothetical protein